MSEISVIVPVYNVEKYLSRCVESILRQTFSNFDLILIDDGSPDRCGMICDQYRQKDMRVHVIHQKNAGLSAARNSGLEWSLRYSDSKWLTFIDSDDWIHPEMLQLLYDAVCQTNLPISICGHYKTEGNSLEIDSSQTKMQIWKTEDFYFKRNVNATIAVAKLYKKECFKNIRYPVGKLHEDEYVTYRILFNYPKLALVDAPLYAYFQNPEGIMHSGWNPRKLDVLEAVQKQIIFFRKRNMKEIYEKRIKVYVDLAMSQYKQCKSSTSVVCIWPLYLKWKITKIFIVYHKKKIFDRKTEIYIAEKFFPHLMNCYWLMHELKNKLKNEGIIVTINSVLRHFRKSK